jgi:tRNA modification GTPase
MGIERTKDKIRRSHIVLLLLDAEDCLSEINMQINEIKELTNNQKLFALINKTDLFTHEPLKAKFGDIEFEGLTSKDHLLLISAKANIGLDGLRKKLIQSVEQDKVSQSDVVVTNLRHYEALVKAKENLDRVREGMQKNISSDLLTQDIRQVLHYIGEITGEITTDEILGNIFGSFCIGK